VTHLTRNELQQWEAGALDGDRARVVAHLASCGECSALLASIVREPTAALPAEGIDVAAFRAAGLHASARLAPRRAIDWQRLAVAAAVLLAVSGTLYYTSGPETTSVQRGTDDAGVVAQSPRGEVDGNAPLRFSWTGAPGAVRLFVVDVTRPEPLVDRTVEGGSFEVSAEERRLFERGSTYHWFVEYRDASGAMITSQTTRFSLR